MKKTKSAKKGMVLILTSVIIFVATSIVAVLSSLVIVTRTKRVNFEYSSRTQIALENASYELYFNHILQKFLTSEEPTVTNSTSTQYSFDSAVTQLTKNVTVICYADKYNPNELYYYEYVIDTSYLNDRDNLVSMTLTTRIDYIRGDADNTNNYSIKEMRFS